MAKTPQGKKEKGGTVAAVERLVTPVLTEMGLRLWDVRFEKEGPDWFLRILIDGDNPLDIDTCEAAARAVNPILDAEDPVDGSYYMELGSAGLGRHLTKEVHFAALQGQKVQAHLVRAGADGNKDVAGILLAKDGTALTLDTGDAQSGVQTLDMANVSFVKLCDDEDLF